MNGDQNRRDLWAGAPPRVDGARPPVPQGDAKPPPPRRRHAGRLILLALVLAALTFVVLRPHGPARHGHGPAGGPVPVVAATAQKGDVDVTLSGLGTVTPLATVTVKTQIAGQLMTLGFREGQTVKAGDFLAQVDPRPYQAQLDQRLGTLAHDEALLNEARIDLARYRRLVAEDSIATQQLDTQASLVRQYQGQVATDRALVDSARLDLSYCRITAPIGGRVGLRQVDAGNYVQTSDPNGIVVITQMRPISVVFTLPEDDLPAVMRRLHQGALLPVTAWDRSDTTALATGRLTTVDNQIDPATGTIKLRAQFANADESLFPNQFVNAHLLVKVLKGATVIPAAAVQRGTPGTYVYVVKADDTVAMRPVTLGPSDKGRVAVEKGLAPGDRVVVDGADKLRDGAKVTLPAAGGRPRPRQAR